MAQLSDTQLIILSNAAQHPNRIALPLPAHLKGGAIKIVVGSLLKKGLLEEVDAERHEPIWRETGDRHGVTLVITEAGFTALGIEPPSAPQETTDADEPLAAEQPAPEPWNAPTSLPATKEPKTREGTKQAAMIAMLRRESGATVEEIVAETGWQPHTVRGAFAGALKKKLALNIVSEKVEGRGRVYRIA